MHADAVIFLTKPYCIHECIFDRAEVTVRVSQQKKNRPNGEMRADTTGLRIKCV